MRNTIITILISIGLAGCSGGNSADDIKLSTEHTKMPDASAFLDVLGTPVTAAENSKPVNLTAYRLLDLSLPSGQIVASDGFLMHGGPFTRIVKSGGDPLMLAVAKLESDERIAFAMIRFSQAQVAKWEMAVTDGQDLAKLKPDEFYGYGVDSATGSFSDPGAQKLINDAIDPDMKFFDRLSAEMEKTSKPTCGWVHVKTTNGSAALFASGFGDGHYASYFGLDEAGNVVALVTDFAVVDWPRRP